MSNLANINVTITATDSTGPGVSSAMSNLSRLGGSFGGIGQIASGVFGGILGAATFRAVTNGIGGIINSAFGLNNRLAESSAASRAIVDALATAGDEGTASLGKLSKAAEQFGKTMREIREREADGMADYADKIDDIKNKMVEAQTEATKAVSDRVAKEKEQLADLQRAHLQSIEDINTNLEDEAISYNERIYDLNNSREDKLASLNERRANDTGEITKEIAELEAKLATNLEDYQRTAVEARIQLLQNELNETNSVYDAQIAKVNADADHEVEIAKLKHDRKIAELNREMARENEAYDIKKKRIEADAASDIAKAKEVADEKVATLQKQLAKEEQMHTRFLRDIQEAYKDAQKTLEEATSGGGGGTSKRMIEWKFDENKPFIDLAKTKGATDAFLDDLQERYVKIGVKSPFNIGDIQNFGKAMVAYTGGSADNMETMLNMAQSLAARNPMQGMVGATRSMVEMFGSGNIVSMARLFDLPKNAFAPLAEAKDATDRVNILNKILTEHGITLGLVDAKARTLGGAFENVKETFNLVAAQITKPVWQVLTDALVNLNDWLFANREQLKEWAGRIADLVGTALPPLISIITTLMGILQKFWSEHGAQVLNFFQKMFEYNKSLVIPALELLQTVWVSVQKVLEDTIIPGLERIFQTIMRLWTEIAPEFKKTLDAIKKWWTDHHVAIENVLRAVWAVIEFVIKTVLETMGAQIKFWLAIFRGDWESAWKTIETFFSNTWENMKTLVKNVWDAIGGYVKSGVNGIIDSINGMLDGIKKLTEVKIDGKVVFGGISVPHIPRLAMGGIITSPTLALLGEAGPEAVVPLSRNAGAGAGGTQVNISVSGNYILDESQADGLAETIGNVFVQKLALQGKYL
jgi:hypothetical protein